MHEDKLAKLIPCVSNICNRRKWAELDKSYVQRIAEHALSNDVADYVHIRATCNPWRKNTEDPKLSSILDPRFHPRQWIVLPADDRAGDDNEARRRMVNISNGAKYVVQLPSISGHAIAASSSGAPGGIMVLINDCTAAIRLLNPITGQTADLPSVEPVMSRTRTGRLDRGFHELCKVTGAGFVGDHTVVLHLGRDDRLVAARLYGGHWEMVSRGTVLCSAFSLNGTVYFADTDGLMFVDLDKPSMRRLRRAAAWPEIDTETVVHMADDGAGRLLVIINRLYFKKEARREDDRYYTVEFDVFRLDAEARELVPVRNIGKRALFVGNYCGALVVPASASAPGTIVHNSIYFQHNGHPRFFVRRLSPRNNNSQVIEAPKGSFLDDITSYVKWSGRKTMVAPAASIYGRV